MQIKRKEVNGLRYYQLVDAKGQEQGLFPSITTVLGQTSDKSGLDRWRNQVGEEEANRISQLSLGRGNVMHRLLELYKSLSGTPDSRIEELKNLMQEDAEVNKYPDYIQPGFEFFQKFWYNHSRFFDRIKKVLAAEQFLWSVKGGGYAGTVDNVSELVDGRVLVIDYKNSRKPKREDWIQDYFMQAAAYYVAYWERTGIKPTGAEIWIANEKDMLPQIFALDENDIKYYFRQFSDRLKQFHELANI